MLFILAKGILLGLAIAAPVGPIGTLCIARTLERGFWAGVVGGLGTALADATYAALAGAGFAAFSLLLEAVAVPLQLLGGAFMLWLGFVSFKPRGEIRPAKVGARDLLATAFSTYALTIANPTTILSFAAIFAGLGLAEEGNAAQATTLVLGVFAGSMLWWVFLCGLVSVLHHRLPQGFSTWIARGSGVVLIGFGAIAMIFGFRALLN